MCVYIYYSMLTGRKYFWRMTKCHIQSGINILPSEERPTNVLGKEIVGVNDEMCGF